MNRIMCIIIAFGSTVCGALGEDASRVWGEQVEGYLLSIQVTKTLFACGEPIKLAVTIKNSASTNGSFPRVHPLERGYPATVLLPIPEWIPFRQAAPFTEEGLRRTSRFNYTSYGGGLAVAGAEQTFDLDLNAVYDMHWPGEYTVTVSTSVRKREEKGIATLMSNQLKITVESCKP